MIVFDQEAGHLVSINLRKGRLSALSAVRVLEAKPERAVEQIAGLDGVRPGFDPVRS
nr:hypothetical protein RKHAN_00334 [Rhizobium sp. Khangiran2]